MAEEVEIMSGPEDRERTKDNNMLSSGCDTATEVMNRAVLVTHASYRWRGEFME